MNSKIEQTIEELEQYIDTCKPQSFSSNKIIVNKDQIEELLTELRLRTPEEINRYQKMISNKEAILADAQTKADAITIRELTRRAEAAAQQAMEQEQFMRGFGIWQRFIQRIEERQRQEPVRHRTR